MHLNLEAFVLVHCICLNLFDQSFMGIDILNSQSVAWSYQLDFLWAIILHNYVVEREIAPPPGGEFFRWAKIMPPVTPNSGTAF